MSIGFCLSSICLIPSCSPYLRSRFFDTNIEIVVPYIIEAMIAIPMISILTIGNGMQGENGSNFDMRESRDGQGRVDVARCYSGWVV